jgi:hypothetical protein
MKTYMPGERWRKRRHQRQGAATGSKFARWQAFTLAGCSAHRQPAALSSESLQVCQARECQGPPTREEQPDGEHHEAGEAEVGPPSLVDGCGALLAVPRFLCKEHAVEVTRRWRPLDSSVWMGKVKPGTNMDSSMRDQCAPGPTHLQARVQRRLGAFQQHPPFS